MVVHRVQYFFFLVLAHVYIIETFIASLDDYLALKEQTLALLESISIPLEQAQAFVENEAMEKALKNL